MTARGRWLTWGGLLLALLILEGFGSDQVTMRSLSRSFARMGMHVFTFDFSGHGVSPGALCFDNAATDRLARQAIAAQALFAAEASLAGEQIVVGGLQGVVILVLVLLHGRLLQRLGGSPLLVALLQAIVLYWLILPQGVLFTR